MVVGTKSGVQFMSLDPKEYPLPNCLNKANKTINIGDAKRSRPALFSYRGDLFFYSVMYSTFIWLYLDSAKRLQCYIPEKDILFLGGTCMEDNINYHGGDVQQPEEWQHTVEGCKKYCRTEYPKALFFSWVSPQYADTSIRSRCYCKTTYQRRTPLTGITSGRVDCGKK